MILLLYIPTTQLALSALLALTDIMDNVTRAVKDNFLPTQLPKSATIVLLDMSIPTLDQRVALLAQQEPVLEEAPLHAPNVQRGTTAPQQARIALSAPKEPAQMVSRARPRAQTAPQGFTATNSLRKCALHALLERIPPVLALQLAHDARQALLRPLLAQLRAHFAQVEHTPPDQGPHCVRLANLAL